MRKIIYCLGIPHLNLNLPANMKKRGRPRGINCTVLGLPKRRKVVDKPLCFKMLSVQEKKKKILGWIFEDRVAESVYSKKDIVLTRDVPTSIPIHLLDENIDIYLIREYFDDSAWRLFMQIFSVVKNKGAWNCPTCKKDLNLDQSVACESCLQWFHLTCTTSKVLAKDWFCSDCLKLGEGIYGIFHIIDHETTFSTSKN